MANPTWVTRSGNLGTIEERVFYQLNLQANNAVSYELISGNLPAGLALRPSGVIDGIPSVRNILQGVPFDVGENVTSKFVVRATSTDSKVNDRTFELTVTGQDKPEILTQTDSLGTFIEGDYVEVQVEARDLDNETLTWSVSEFELPPGLTLDSSTGIISGYIEPQEANDGAIVGYDLSQFDEFEFDFATKSVDRNYYFAISVTDGKDIVQRPYTIFVYSRNNLTADNTNITADFDGVITADQDTLRRPVLNYTSTNLGETFHDDYFAIQFTGEDFDGDQIQFELDTDGSSLTVPSNLTLNADTGWLYGNILYQSASEVEYSFRIRAIKKDRPTYASDWVTFTLTVLGDSSRDISWVTPANLGTIYTGDISTLAVEATDANGRTLKYSLDNNQINALPQGLQFTDNGLLIGRVSFELFSLDSGTTTIDQDSNNYNETTFDRTFSFQVTAKDASELITATRTFTVRVAARTNEPYEGLYVRALPNLQQRTNFTALVNNIDIFKPEYIYRNGDFYFGKQTDIRMLMLPGVTARTAAQFIAAMGRYHYDKTLRFGEIKTARALNADGTVKYEVVYIDIVDNIEGISYTHTLESASAEYTGKTTIYPNSLANMITKIKTDIGVSTSAVYPDWMTSKQEDGTVLGWIPAVVLAYTKEGYSKQLAYNIQNNQADSLDFKSISFEIDRYIWDVDLSDNFDKTFRTYDELLETTFDRFNKGTFVGDGSTTLFALTETITNPSSVLITINGTPVNSTTYTVVGNYVVFDTAPAALTTIVIEDTNFTSDVTETTFDNRNTRFITDTIGYREKDYGDKYLKFPTNGVLD